jgi:tetratricopeptide (TPR) repeat protein
MRRLIIILIIILLLLPSLSAQTVSREEEALYVAKKAYEDGFYEVALNLFQRFITNFPQSQSVSEASLFIAQCCLQKDKFIPALTRLEKLASDPQAEGLQDRVLYWMAEVHFRGGDQRRAISLYQRIIEEFPDSELLAHAYYSRGWCLFELGEYTQAIEDFNRVRNDFPEGPLTQDAQFKNLNCLYKLRDYEELKKNILSFKKEYPKDNTYTSSIHFFLAECNFHLNKYQQAVQQYQLALDSSVESEIEVFSQLGLAWCSLKLKDYSKALNLLEGINPDDLNKKEQEGLLLTKANLFTEMQNFPAARAAWSNLGKIATEPEMKMEAYLGQGEALYNLEQYPEAIALYREAKEMMARLPSQLIDKLYYELAWAFLKDGQFKEAIAEFQKAASFASDEIVKVTALCQIGDTYQDAEDYKKAIQSYDQILMKYPDSLYVDYVQYQLGLACLRSSRYEEAVLAFRTLLLNFPESKLKAQAIYSLALSLFQKQDYQGCTGALQKYMSDLENNDLEAEALYLRATSWYNLGEFAEAMNAFKQIIRRAGDIKIIQKAEYEIADCLYQLGKEKEALKRFKILRAKYPDSTLSPEVTWWLGGYYFRKGNLTLSRRYFSSLIRDFPGAGLVADGYYALGLLDQEEDKLDSAISNFKNVLKTASKDLKAQAGIAIADILIQQDRLNEGELAYRQAIENSPALAGLIYPKISRIYEERGDFDQAILFLRQALSLVSMKEAPALQFKIARVYEKKSDYSQAIEEYLKISYLYPGDSQLIVKAYLSGAQIYENQEDWLKARDIYLKVASMDTEEAKYARERLEWIKRNQKPEQRNQKGKRD